MIKQKNHLSRAKEVARKEVQTFFKKALGTNYDQTLIEITQPPKSDLGFMAVPCFRLAEKTGKKPHELSGELSNEFKKNFLSNKKKSLLVEAKAFGPYINFFVDNEYFSSLVIHQILQEGQNFGDVKVTRRKRLMIEYSQPNTHKEFHVGHLRNVCTGNALVNLNKAVGYNVVAANYIGDIGAHVAKCLWALKKFHSGEKLPKNKGKYLGRIYTEATQKIDENEEYKKEVSKIQQGLENNDRKLLMLWKKTRRWSLEEFYKIYRRLNISFDVYFFESEVEQPGKKIVSDLLQKGIAEKSEGAVIIDLEKYSLRQLLLLKSDGTSLYSTKDLALAKLKFQKYRIDKGIIVTDNRQSFYFQQIFKTLQVMGFKKDLVHVGYDFVTTKDGAMSSRKGNVVLYEDFEDEVITMALQETKARHKEWPKSKIFSVSKKIAYAAIKHDMLSQGTGTVITFDAKKALQFQGKTGPYLLYVLARISSILKKSKSHVFHNIDFSLLKTPQEKNLVITLSNFPEVVQEAAIKNEPSILTSYLHDLAKNFSSFYQEIQVLSDNKLKRHARLALIRSVKNVMERGLEILGIETVSAM